MELLDSARPDVMTLNVTMPGIDGLANHAHVLAADVIAVDETWWRLTKKGASKRWWVWSVAREDAVSYRLLPSRSADAARMVLGGYTGVSATAAEAVTSHCPARRWILPLYLDEDRLSTPFCCYGNDVDCDRCGGWVVFDLAARRS